MTLPRLLVALTVVNLGCVLLVLTQIRPGEADSIAPVLRGRALEIVDAQGRVRASIVLHAPDPSGHPEAVVLRLIDPHGRPSVKLAGSVRGGGLGLVGEADATQAILKAEGAESALKLATKDGRHRLLTP
jgi:hypothetical protein